jgi:hypothetical protein
MHGRKRETAEQTAERKAAAAQKARITCCAAPVHTLACSLGAQLTRPCASYRGCAAQAAGYAKLQAGVLAQRAAGALDAGSLALSAKLLEVNPEVRGAWAWRRAACELAAAAAAMLLRMHPPVPVSVDNSERTPQRRC